MMRRSTHGEPGEPGLRGSAYDYASTGSGDSHDEPRSVDHDGGGGGYRDNMFDSEVEGGMAGAVASVEAAQRAWEGEEDEEQHHDRGMDQHPSQYDVNEDGSDYRGEEDGSDRGGDDPDSPHAAPMQFGQYEEDGVLVYGEEEEENQLDGSLLPPPVDRHEEYDDPPFYRTLMGRTVICVVLVGIAVCLMVIGIVQPWKRNNGVGVQNAPPTRAPTRKFLFLMKSIYQRRSDIWSSIFAFLSVECCYY